MKVYVRAPYPEKRLAELKELFEEVVYEPWTETGERYYEDEMLENLKRVEPDALITELDRVTEKVLNGYGKLRFIGDCRAAPANIDTDACTAHGVPVLCTPGRNNQAVAELVVGLIIMQLIASHPMAGRETSSVEHAAEVNFAPANFIITPTEKNTPEAIQWAKDGKWVEGTTPYYLWMGHELQGRKVGFVGFGAVGRAAAKIMDGFDCDICFYDPFIPNDIGHYKKTELEKIFAECDIVSLHLPVTDETRGMIDEKLLRSMKPTALFVNSARSAVVDTKALIKLLNDKAIAGAIIDVLDTEPPTAEDLQIAYCPNTILTPHIGGSSFEVTVHQADILNERIRQWLKGENLERIVFNRAVLAK